MKPKTAILLAIIVIILGVISRLVNSDNIFINKYLGDSLYAVLVYLLISISPLKLTLIQQFYAALLILLCIEFFQLTLIPLHLSQSDNFFYKLLAKILGTTFSGYDILAYIVGLLVIFGFDRSMQKAKHASKDLV